MEHMNIFLSNKSLNPVGGSGSVVEYLMRRLHVDLLELLCAELNRLILVSHELWTVISQHHRLISLKRTTPQPETCLLHHSVILMRLHPVPLKAVSPWLHRCDSFCTFASSLLDITTLSGEIIASLACVCICRLGFD